MNLENVGYDDYIEKLWNDCDAKDFKLGRVIAEHKERYIVYSEQGEFEAEITGNLRFSANSRADFPAVGDWVALMIHEPDLAIIHKILPRFSSISRQAVGKFAEEQIIAANIDYAFIVQSVNRDFNINRLERYLTICNASKVEPIIILTKIDLITEPELSEIITSINNRIHNIQIIPISNHSDAGIDDLKGIIQSGKSYCLLGSSGVGKSTLSNKLSGREAMKTDEISKSTNKGRHVTSHRELIILESGAILIDNPGMREVGIVDNADGLEATFDIIYQFAEQCRFADCKHINEKDCAVIEALENGDIERSSYENYLKMQKEKNYFETSVSERRQKEKIFGKIVKDYYKKDVKKKNF